MKNWMRSFGKTALAAVLAAGTLSVTSQVQAAQLGNNSANIINDGVIATYNGDTYYANMNDGGKLYINCDGSKKKLSDHAATDINVLGSSVFYLTDDQRTVRRLDRSTGSDDSVFKASAAIDEMYVTSDNLIWYLSGGNVYVRNEDGDTAEAVNVSENIQHFIPADTGVIYATGSPMNYTLYAGKEKIRGSVSSFYDVDGVLYMNCGGTDYEAEISDLLDGNAAAAVTLWATDSGLDASTAVLSDEAEICEECDANAASVPDNAVTTSDWSVAEAEYDALLDGDSAALDASRATSAASSILFSSSVSEGQRNMVRRAYQQHKIAWTPKKNITGWNGEYTYEAGKTYTGLPYGQPVTNGGYVPWSASLNTFVEAVNNSSSVMYTKYSTYNKRAPYYSTDCSGFVSWAWNTSGRLYTRVFANHSTEVSNQSVYSCQIGDAFCKAGSHVVMVSDIGVNSSGKIVYIDIIEETPPITKLTRYGTGGSKTLDDMSAKYLDKGYVLLRSTTRSSVKYTANEVVQIPEEIAGSISINQTSLELGVGQTSKLTYKSDAAGTAKWESMDTSVVTISSDGTVKGVKTGTATIKVTLGHLTATTTVSVLPGLVELVSANAENGGGVTVTWKKLDGASGYTIYRKTSGSSWAKIATAAATATSYKDSSDLSAGTRYYYSVGATIVASGKTVNGTYNTTGVNAVTAPAVPKLATLTAIETYKHKMTWNSVSGAAGYQVLVKTDVDPSWKVLGETTATNYTAANLAAGVTYTYSVRAYVKNSDGNKLCSGYYSAGLSKKVPLNAPTLGTLTQSGTYQQTLTWNAVNGVDGYDVLVKVGSATKWTVKASVTGTSYTATGLTLGTKYRYTVRAYRTINGSKVTSSFNTTGIYGYVKPATPKLKSISYANNSTAQQTITWEPVAGATGYYVYYRMSTTAKWKKAATVRGGSVTSYTKKKLKAGKTYYFTVKAYATVSRKTTVGDQNADGLYIPYVAAPAQPKLTGLTNVSATSQKVTWNAVSGAEGYCVYRRTSKRGTWVKVATVGANTTSATITGLKTGKTYYYSVKSYKKAYGADILSTCESPGLALKAAAPTQ